MSGAYEDLRSLASPRELFPNERALIEQLLATRFEGRDEIRSQLDTARVIAEGQVDTRTVRFELASHINAPVRTALRVPVEGEAADEDGVAIAVLLHVANGLATELEMYRVDGQPIRQRDFAALRTVSVNEGG